MKQVHLFILNEKYTNLNMTLDCAQIIGKKYELLHMANESIICQHGQHGLSTVNKNTNCLESTNRVFSRLQS